MASDLRVYDLIVVGSGIAGLSAAVTAAERGLQVAVISKAEELAETNTRYAQGGIVGHGEGDSAELLIRDIMTAGADVGSFEAIRLVATEGPDLVDRFLAGRVGVPFTKGENGAVALTREAAHSIRRIYYSMDNTGEVIQKALLGYSSGSHGLETFVGRTAIDLITNTHNSTDPQERYRPTRVVGVYVLDNATGEVGRFLAPTVILATGGVGNIFLHTSNPQRATGDGVAMAYRIGAEVTNAEYVQFHPTVLYHRDHKRFLITESLRGEGAWLLNLKDERFMTRYEPEQAELASRDKVARAIYREMENENAEHVKLDARRVEGVNPAERFPNIFSTCLKLGIDMRREPIPVVPAAHYFCGGVKVGLNGETSIPGLFAVGECSCTGVHGANRLASISLLEGLLWGVRAGGHVEPGGVTKKLLGSIPAWVYARNEEVFDHVLVKEDFRTIQSTMWNYAGIIRTRKRLQRAVADLNYLTHRIEQFYQQAMLTRGIIELRNSVLTAGLVARAALANPVSKGCHYLE